MNDSIHLDEYNGIAAKLYNSAKYSFFAQPSRDKIFPSRFSRLGITNNVNIVKPDDIFGFWRGERASHTLTALLRCALCYPSVWLNYQSRSPDEQCRTHVALTSNENFFPHFSEAAWLGSSNKSTSQVTTTIKRIYEVRRFRYNANQQG